jgi:uncharacterized membrane protein YphA (DoxX/SURF4 family)
VVGDLDFVAIGFRFVLGTTFLLAGLAKLPRRVEFMGAVRMYGILPGAWVSPVARFIPPVEVALGGLLIVGLGTRVVAAGVGVVLVVFVGAATLSLARGAVIDCGCYAVGTSRRLTWAVVARNLVFASMSAVVVATAPSTFAVDGLLFGVHAQTGVTRNDAVALLFAATIVVLGLTLAGELFELRRRHKAVGLRLESGVVL